jgi:multiple sugar transport system ATP-binding protein
VLQIGTPRELYERPRSLFVAGFIGSPAMNFLPARWREGRLELPIGALAAAPGWCEQVQAVEGALVAGFRPEHVQLVSDDEHIDRGLVFEVQVDVVEWLGADLFVYFDVALAGFTALALPEDLDIGAVSAGRQSLVARIDPACGVKEGDTVRLHLAPEKLQVFAAASGENLN